MRFMTWLNVALIMLLCSLMLLVSPREVLNLINFPGLMVVVGGSLCAMMLSRSQTKVIALLKSLPLIIKGEAPGFDKSLDFKQLLRFAHLYRSGHVKQLEEELKAAQQPLLRKALRLVLDRHLLEDIGKILDKDCTALLRPDQEKAQMLRLMSSYAPAFGMLGTLLGMIHMLYGLGDIGLGQVGKAMGFAMLTTLYGLVVANLICKPLAIKVERKSQKHKEHLVVLLEGLDMLYVKKHPLIIYDMLEAHGMADQSIEEPTKKPVKLAGFNKRSLVKTNVS